MTRATKDRSRASTLGHDDERDDLGSSYLLEEEDMESDGVFSQRFTRKCLREIDKSKLNPTKRKFIDETSFGDLKRISPFIVPHDLMEWLAMNIDTGKRTPCVALSPEGGVTGVAVGNNNASAQDVDCDDTQDWGAGDVNINRNKDINPMENGKSVEEDVCGSLDDWLQNPIPFGVELEAPGSAGIKIRVHDVTPIAIAPFSSGTRVGSPKPQEEPVVLLSTREPSPDRDEEKAWLKEEEKFKSKKIVASPISAGAKYKKIKTDGKTQAMYKYFIMKRYNMNKTKKGKLKVFDPTICGKELRRACQNFQNSFFDLLFFTIVRDGHWIGCVVNLLHKQFNLFDLVDNGNLDMAARNLFAYCCQFTNLKRIVAEEPDFIVDLNSFKPD
ncbi:hypothetical protein D1007_28108 [Hordeum vulgare]|nr:hypothetical protein D1007_28108 [Hordeum vulgare]